jgi:hypothetical protein
VSKFWLKRIGVGIDLSLRATNSGSGLRLDTSTMMNFLVGAALLGAAYAQNDALPQIDLGYEIYQAAGFNVCFHIFFSRSPRTSES